MYLTSDSTELAEAFLIGTIDCLQRREAPVAWLFTLVYMPICLFLRLFDLILYILVNIFFRGGGGWAKPHL